MAWYHKLFGLCEHDWEEVGREYHSPRDGKNLNWDQFERLVNGWTVFLYKCKRCGKSLDNVYHLGDWRGK